MFHVQTKRLPKQHLGEKNNDGVDASTRNQARFQIIQVPSEALSNNLKNLPRFPCLGLYPTVD